MVLLVYENWAKIRQTNQLKFEVRENTFILVSTHQLKVLHIHYTGLPKKSLWCDLEEKCLRNSKFFFNGVFLSLYIFTSSQEVRAFWVM